MVQFIISLKFMLVKIIYGLMLSILLKPSLTNNFKFSIAPVDVDRQGTKSLKLTTPLSIIFNAFY